MSSLEEVKVGNEGEVNNTGAPVLTQEQQDKISTPLSPKEIRNIAKNLAALTEKMAA